MQEEPRPVEMGSSRRPPVAHLAHLWRDVGAFVDRRTPASSSSEIQGSFDPWSSWESASTLARRRRHPRCLLE